MIYLDTSALLSLLLDDHPTRAAVHHILRSKLLRDSALCTSTHALAEVYSAVTQPRLHCNRSPEVALGLIRGVNGSRIEVAMPSEYTYERAYALAARLGLRGPTFYDVLHLRTAEGCGATHLIHSNEKDFRRLAPQTEVELTLFA